MSDSREQIGTKPGRVRFLLLLGGILLAAATGYRFLAAYSAGPADVDVRSEAFLKRIAATVNKQFPRKVDADTEVTSVTALEGVFIYHYRLVNLVAAEQDVKTVMASLQAPVTRATCGNAVTRANFLNKGITLRYAYADKGGKALASFDVTRADCGA